MVSTLVELLDVKWSAIQCSVMGKIRLWKPLEGDFGPKTSEKNIRGDFPESEITRREGKLQPGVASRGNSSCKTTGK